MGAIGEAKLHLQKTECNCDGGVAARFLNTSRVRDVMQSVAP